MAIIHEQQPEPDAVRKYEVLHAYFQKEAMKFKNAGSPLMREAHLLQVDAILDERNEFVAKVGHAAVFGVSA